MEELAALTKAHTELVHSIDTVWVAICAALIFQMEGGFALLEAGFVRSKNSVSVIAKVIIDIMFGGIAFYAVGFGIAYGESNGWGGFDIGIPNRDLGLGLTISQHLIHQHNGLIECHSEQGKTCFSLYLPMETQHAEA